MKNCHKPYIIFGKIYSDERGEIICNNSFDLTNFDFYHHVDDEIDQLDFVFMATTINKLIPGIMQICNTDSKEIQMYATN